MSQQKIDLFRKEYPQYELAILSKGEYPELKEAFNLFRIKGWEQ